MQSAFIGNQVLNLKSTKNIKKENRVEDREDIYIQTAPVVDFQFFKIISLVNITQIKLSSDLDQGLGTWDLGNGNREYPHPQSQEMTVKSHWPPTTTHPQFLTMKECSHNKVPLVRMSQDDPLNPSNTKNNQVDGENDNQGESNMIKEKFIKYP